MKGTSVILGTKSPESGNQRALEQGVELLLGAMGSARLRELAETFGLDNVIGLMHDKIVAAAIAAHGSKCAAGRKLGVNRTTLSERMARKR